MKPAVVVPAMPTAQSNARIDRSHKEAGDAVLAAAERAHVDYLVTSDRQLIQKATVPALAPKDTTALFEVRAKAV